MAEYNELKAAIRAAIYDNTEQAITGEVLQDILVAMVDALGVPEGGIPASELTQSVQQALEKALSAYQKPGTGIPASDIASGVIPDVSQFITKTVTDLVHYYTQEETYTQEQVNDLIGAISQFHYEIYASLEDITTPASNVLYLIGPTGSGSDQYEEYVYANDAFTKIGDTSIDLTGYLRYTPQTLTEAQKQQARTNIGATAPEVFWATYGTTTAAEIDAAVAAGKLVVCEYDDRCFYLAFYLNSDTYIYFGNIYTTSARYVRVKRDNNSWSTGTYGFQVTRNLAQTLSGNETSETYYPSTKAVADALGKMGVVSQTQTWTQAADGGYDYTMSNPVSGIIPQFFIDIVESAGAVFNATTGYFELNGLTDISYEEMRIIYNMRRPQNIGDQLYGYSNLKIRTNFALFDEATKRWNRYGNIGNNPSIILTSVAYDSENMSVFNFAPDESNNLSNYGSILSINFAFESCKGLKRVIGRINCNYISAASNASDAFTNCWSLEEVKLNKIKVNISFKDCPRLSLESVVYMVTNATNTTAITITLHATAYARCQADTTEYTYSGQTYTGIIAYAAAKNITIASA